MACLMILSNLNVLAQQERKDNKSNGNLENTTAAVQASCSGTPAPGESLLLNSSILCFLSTVFTSQGTSIFLTTSSFETF